MDKSVLREKYDYCFSIGSACSCTESLRAAGLQFHSLPFDWVDGSTLKKRSELIASDFSHWIDKELLTPVFTHHLDKEEMTVYRNSVTDINFVHDFATSKPFDSVFSGVSEKYRRRCLRLLQHIESSRSVLAVYIDQPYQKEPVSDADIIYAREILMKRFPHVCIDILYLHNRDDVPYRQRLVTSPAEGITQVAFCYNDFHTHTFRVNRHILFLFFSTLRLTGKHLTLRNRLLRLKAQYRWIRKKVMYAITRRSPEKYVAKQTELR